MEQTALSKYVKAMRKQYTYAGGTFRKVGSWFAFCSRIRAGQEDFTS